jgi:heme/copper-type cytochrome/quinol oxidase subunit 3
MAEAELRAQTLPVGSFGRRSSGWYGVWCLIATEGAIFLYLLFSYFYLAAQSSGRWPPQGLPSLKLAGPNTVVLLLSSVALYWAERSGARRGSRARLLVGLGSALLLGSVFAGVQWREWHDKAFRLGSDNYASIYFTVTGFHLAHVVIGLLVLAMLFLWAALGYFDRDRHAALTIGAVYWHFVDAVWLAVFTALYLIPRLS